MDTHLVVALADRDGDTHACTPKVRRRIKYAVQCAASLHNVLFGLMSGTDGHPEMVACYEALGVKREQLIFSECKRQRVTTTLEELQAAFDAADRFRAILVLVTSVHHLPRVLVLCRRCLRASFERREYHGQVRLLAAKPAWEELNGDEILDALFEVPRLVLTPIVCPRHAPN